MSASHHGEFSEEQKRLMARLLDQFEGKAKREYSAGRISADDDGDLAMAIASDPEKKIVVIRFGKPTEWIGMGEREVSHLINVLIEKRREITTTPLALVLGK